jgi:hypothetical protein
MCFYDAELVRLRAHTHTDPDARAADIAAALELARRQGATLFELRAALDDFELRGQPARTALIDAAGRIPTNNTWPELARAHARTALNRPEIGEPPVPAAAGPAGASGIADAAGQRHTQTRPWYRKTWVVVAGGVTALLVGAAIAIPIAVTLSTRPASSPSASAMRQWWSRASGHFQQSANALEAAQSAAKADDTAEIAAACQQLHDANASGLQADMPTPNPALTIAVQEMIDDIHTAAHICMSFGPTSSVDDINQFRSYLAHAGAHLQTATKIMKRDGLPGAPPA